MIGLAKKFKGLLVAVVFLSTLVAPVLLPAQVHAAPAVGEITSECEKGILTFPVWFRGMGQVERINTDGTINCTIASPDAVGGLGNFIWKIVLNVIDIILQIIGYAAVVFIIIGGFQYLTGGGNPDALRKAKATITNAIIGLIISLASVAIVNLIFGFIK